MERCIQFIAKSLLVVAAIFSHMDTWAADTDSVAANNASQNIFSQPWIWIGIATIGMVALFGPSIRRNKEFAVIRKKTAKKGAGK